MAEKKTNTSRKTSSRKSARSSARKGTSKRRSQNKNTVVQENAIVITVAVFSVLLFIGILGIGGSFATVCQIGLFSLFGLLAYTFPIAVIGSIIYSYIRKNNSGRVPKLIVFWLFFILCCFFVQLLTGGYEMSARITDTMKYSQDNHLGGGIAGGLPEIILRPVFGLIGAFIIDIALMIICLVFLTEKSFVDAAFKGGSKVYESSVEAGRAAKAAREQRRSEKQLRTEKKRVGIGAYTIAPPGSNASLNATGKSDNLTELKLESPQASDNMDNLQHAVEDSYFKNTVIEQLNANKASLRSDLQPEAVETALPESYEPERAGEFTGAVNYDREPEIQLQGIQETESAENIAGPANYQEISEEPGPQEPPIAAKRSHRASFSEADKSAGINEIDNNIKSSSGAKSGYNSYPLDLLQSPSGKSITDDNVAVKNKLQSTLDSFGVNAKVTGFEMGPSVTRYEILPSPGVKVSKIVGLSDDIKLALAAADIRIEAPIPGKSAIGIEVPNKVSVNVTLRELLESAEFKNAKSRLAFAAGKDIGGNVVVSDIAKMPHLLIAGATGSGKSVCINTIIMSILYHASPDEVKLIMIDPKVVELSVYNGIPHLLTPVVTDPKKAASALNWAVNEMTDRYNKFATTGVRDIFAYNRHVDEITDVPPEDMPAKMPQIVVIVDELADLMMVAPGDVEDAICRLAQLARAAGIHLIIATQRPSVNVITGLIKANMPSRIAFSVSSGVDSRTILDMNGAEKLLGKGDMLYYPQGLSKPKRVQGAFVDDKEVAAVVQYIKENNESEQQEDHVGAAIDEIKLSSTGNSSGVDTASFEEKDELFTLAAEFIIDSDKASIGALQRKFRIGFNRAARIMDQLAEAEIVGPEEGTKPRQILMGPEQFEQYKEEYL